MNEHPGSARPPDAPLSDSIAALCAAHEPVVSCGRFAPGAVFGDWRLTAFIGRGGNGEVYCAEHTSLGTPAAVKVLVREEERAKARFTREAKLLSSLKSDAFPHFYAYGEANGTAYLAMELLEPGDLPTGDKAIAQFLLKVCDAVSELHAHGYVHRDIKPSNILWRTGTTGVPPVAFPVLVDLGLVKDLTPSNSQTLTPPSSPQTLGGVGTPGYGAPEQLERGEVSFASDIHSLGVLADQCFNGNPPRRWKRIIQRATSSIPAHRYPSVTAFARAIRRRRFGWYVGVTCVVAVAATGICMPFLNDDVARNAEPEQAIHRIGKGVLEMRMEHFQAELSKGWPEMTNELRKFYELGVWQREMIGRQKDFWAKGNLEHQAEEKSRIKRDVELLMRDWNAAKERHAERIRGWSIQAEELGLAAPTPPEEYSKLRGDVEYVLGNRLVIDCMQL